MSKTVIKRHKKIRNDLSGKTFGILTCIKPTGEFRNSARVWLCKCQCGKDHEATANHLVCGNIKSCGCSQYHSNKKNGRWKGYGEISGRYFSQLKRGANSRNLDFDVSIEYIWNLFLEQGRICKMTKLPIKFGTTAENKSKEQTASLDRIDPSIGYVDGNLQWVHQDVNFAKQSLTQEKFIKLCKLVAKNN